MKHTLNLSWDHGQVTGPEEKIRHGKHDNPIKFAERILIPEIICLIPISFVMIFPKPWKDPWQRCK